MKTMGFIVWLLPILFMLHDFEEIFMAEVWYSRYKDKIKTLWPKKLPFGLDQAESNLTASITIGVLSEFIVMILVCLFSVIFNNYIVWYGFFVGFVLTMPLLHLRDYIRFRNYVPGIVTCAILFIPCIWILYQANTILHYGFLAIVLSTVLVNVIGGFFTFKFLHGSMTTWSKWLNNYSKAEIHE